MAHFALVEDGRVLEVIVVDNKDCDGGEFPDSEPAGQEFIASLGLEGTWLQTSYNNSFRGWFAATGGYYDAEGDAFHCGSPGDQWALDRSTWQWVSPTGIRVPSL